MTTKTTKSKQVRYTDGSYSREVEEQPVTTSSLTCDERELLKYCVGVVRFLLRASLSGECASESSAEECFNKLGELMGKAGIK